MSNALYEKKLQHPFEIYEPFIKMKLHICGMIFFFKDLQLSGNKCVQESKKI